MSLWANGVWAADFWAADFWAETSSPPVFSGTIPNQTFDEDQAITPLDLSTYFAGATSFALTGTLPAGLSFNTGTGVISGTPTTAGLSTGFVVTGINADGSDDSNSFSIEILEVSNPPIFSGTIPNRQYEEDSPIPNFDTSIYFTGAASYALTGTLPTGLSFNTGTGVISGTPTTQGTASGLVVTATNPDGTADSNAFSIQIVAVGALAGRGRRTLGLGIRM